MSGWKHDELAADLAGYLAAPTRMVWTDMQLGPSGSPRPDVYTLEKSYSRPRPSAFEVKVSRSDLRSDTTSGKWQSYLRYAGSVTFAVPEGLCTVADIPEACGLIVRKEQVWRYARRPTLQSVTPPFEACMKLLIDGVSRTYAARDPQPRRLELWTEHEGIRKKFGSAVALAAKDLVAAERRTTDARDSADYERNRIDVEMEAYRARLRKQADDDAGEWMAIRSEVIDWLGIEGQAGTWAVRKRLRDLKAACDADARVSEAGDRLEAVRRALEQALRSLPQASAEAA